MVVSSPCLYVLATGMLGHTCYQTTLNGVEAAFPHCAKIGLPNLSLGFPMLSQSAAAASLNLLQAVKGCNVP
jgi:hypothetical protein